MDFFERQEQAHRNTKLLVVYFVTGVAVMIATIYLALLLVFSGARAKYHHQLAAFGDDHWQQQHSWLWEPKLFFGVALGTLAIIIIGSVSKTAQLAQGGSAVAEMMGGRLISPNTTDFDERKLRNVVEEMALASGVPVPQVYVMDDEHGINAFAAGHSTSDAAVCVTRGCMKLLTRNELQGVIGHEFSHILNGDMRLNLRLVGIVFGILCLAIVGRVLIQTRGGRSSRDRNPLPLVGLILIIIGYIGVFFGRLIQAAVSRQREFLADASSVQFTRNPSGLSGALKKIGAHSLGSTIESAQAEQVSHMFFGSGRDSVVSMMSTHPPIPERIRAIEPTWDGTFPKLQPELIETVERAAINEMEEARHRPAFYVPGLSPLTESPRSPQPLPVPAQAPANVVPPVISIQAAMPSVGTLDTAHLRYAVELRDSFSPVLKNAAHDALGASSLVYALLMSTDATVREQQLQMLASVSAATRQEAERLLADVDAIASRAKLPLLDLALPGLRQLSPAQYAQFRKSIQSLIEADGEIDLFEYVLQKIVLRHLDPQFSGARKPVIQYYALKPLAGDCSILLSALAHVGSDDAGQCEAAFRQGAQNLSYYAQSPLIYVPNAQCDLQQVDAALNRLTEAVPQIKKNVLNACVQVVAADGVIQELEAELLRAVADALDCPIPPFIQPKSEAVAA